MVDVGAIAGGVAGGVVGLLAIIALLWFCVFKKRRTQEDDLDDALVSRLRVDTEGTRTSALLIRVPMARSSTQDEVDLPFLDRRIFWTTNQTTMMLSRTRTAMERARKCRSMRVQEGTLPRRGPHRL